MTDPEHLNIPSKANWILNIFLVAFILITLRLWHLALGQHEDKLQESRTAGRRTEIEAARRGGIRDRFNEPLALNKLKYQAAILYSDFKVIPSVKWEEDETGKKVKVLKRKNYIHDLSILLGEELKLDPHRIEDEIHAKASQFYNIPFVIKENLNEEEYARIKMLSREWPGLKGSRVSERVYPKGKMAGDVIGHLGKIGKEEFEKVIQEREELKIFLDGLDKGGDLPLPENFVSLGAVKKRLKVLEELAYTAADWVGKAGIEASFEEDLRGYQGKKTVFRDTQGHILREYPGSKEALPGKRILLSLSSELQEYAEKLLALSEETRDTRVKIVSGATKAAEKRPWIKGGSIVALDPLTGEVIAMATYPRYNPNDFNKKQEESIHGWLEDEINAAAIWDNLSPLSREKYDAKQDLFFDENVVLTWDLFLELILAPQGETLKTLKQEFNTIEKAVKRLHTSDGDPKISDILHLAIDERLFSNPLLKQVGRWTLSQHRETEQYAAQLSRGLEEILKVVFIERDFKHWRDEHEVSFLKSKRDKEKLEKRYPRPYLDYIDDEEKQQFMSLWEANKNTFLLTLLEGKGEASPYTEALLLWKKEIETGAHRELNWVKAYQKLKTILDKLPPLFKGEYLASLRTYSDLIRPLKFTWRLPKKGQSILLEKNLARSFQPPYGWGFGRSHAFRQAAIQGSIFKLVTAYSALLEHHNKNIPLTFQIDDRFFRSGKNYYVGYHASGKPIPQLYKGGRIPRSHSSNIGKLDLLTAIELSSNPYFALLASDVIKNPSDLIEAAKKFSFGKKTGIDLPYELSGKLPTDLDTNPTGLFATSIGQHSMIVTPLQTSLLLASLANGGSTLKPQIVTMKAGKKQGKYYEEIPTSNRYKCKDAHYLTGLDFPLAGIPPCKEEPLITKTKPELLEKVFLPEKIKKVLLEGMRRVVKRQAKTSLLSLSRIYKEHPGLIADFVDMKNHLIGKTSTAEAIERLDLDKPDEQSLYTHVWFGGISYEKPVKPNKFEKPELVVVVYLKYGGYGNEAAPLAAEIAKKWKEIKAAHAK